MMRSILRSFCLAAALAAPVSGWAQVPPMLPVQGTLYDVDGAPVDGTLSVTFTLYADVGRSVPLWTETRNTVFTRGSFAVYLGDLSALNMAIFQGRADAFIGIRIGGDTEIGPFRVATAAYASQAALCDGAETLEGLTSDEIVSLAIAEGDARYAFAAHVQPWSSITDVPAGFADGIDNTVTEAEVDAFVANNGYASADHTQAWSTITSVPGGFADGVDNTSTEAEVDFYVSNNGYSVNGHGHAWSEITSVPAGFADGIDNDTVLTEAQVDDYVSDNNFALTGHAQPWSSLTGVPAGFADGTDNVLSEAEVDAYVNNNGYAAASHSQPWSSLTGVPAGFADGVDNDTDTVLSEAQVDGYANNNGYARSGGRVRPRNCYLTGIVNTWDNVMNYQCPNDQIMQGMYSVHDNGKEDRQFQFYCCEMYVD
jgi:hypothetical protein